MKKFLPAVAFTLTIIVLLSVFFLSMRNNATKCDIGIFYYVWYNIKDPNSWNPQKIVDSPILGYYDSGAEAVIKEHLVWFDGLSIDLIIVSWWGFEYIDSYAAFIENATHQVFRTTIEQGSDLRICLMVEPFLERDLPEGELATYDYTEIYDYIYTNFVAKYKTTYYEYNGKPLICFFNSKFLTTNNGDIPKDYRFEIKLVGEQDYTDWIYTDLILENRIAKNKQKTVTPRYDDSRLPDRSSPVIINGNLADETYDEEWKNAIELARKDQIDIITICSWNEYPERTAIEPHYDATAVSDDPYFLYNKTKMYINQLNLGLKE